MEVHLIVNGALLVIIVVGLVWSVLREMHIHAMQRSQEQAATRLTDHLGTINKSLDSTGRLVEQLSKEIAAADSLSRDKRAEMLAYLRDVEMRLTAAVHETRQWIREYARTGTSVFNTNHAGNGGQTNQGGSVHGEQR